MRRIPRPAAALWPALAAFAVMTVLVAGGGTVVRPGDAHVVAAAAGPAAVTPLRNGTGLYPRVVRLAHSGSVDGRIIASVVTFSAGSGIGAIYESRDDGASFAQIGSIADPSAADGKGLCCATLYELPSAVGDNPAGTLLWAASFGANTGPDRRMSLRVWRSLDHGRTWAYLSTIATAATTGGLWEPEFTVAADGRLVAFYSDETDPLHSQKIVRARSSDGVRWSAPVDTVALTARAERPGMPVVRRLPDGHYAMSLELCGSHKCEIRLRTSPDGWNWGTVTSLGTAVRSSDGRYFAHAATIAPLPDGSLLLIGQVLLNADGTVAQGNGATLFVGANGGTGSWRAAPAPVAVPDATNNYCPNYSSALLPSSSDDSVLEIATDYAGTVCTPYFATAGIG